MDSLEQKIKNELDSHFAKDYEPCLVGCLLKVVREEKQALMDNIRKAATYNTSNCVDGTDRLWIDVEPFWNAVKVFEDKP